MNVLIVDNHESSREAIQEIAEAEGHQPVLATDGADALRKIEESDIDIVLTELQLPDLDGLEIGAGERKTAVPIDRAHVEIGFQTRDLAFEAAHAAMQRMPQAFDQVAPYMQSWPGRRIRAAAAKIANEA